MIYLDHPYDVRTHTSRRPTPLTYEHLRKWVEPDEKYIDLRSIEEITNINQQIEQISRFYISSIIQRTISQMVAETPQGFATLQATSDGILKVIPAGGSEEGKIDIKVADGDSATLGAIADAIVAAGAAGTISAKLRRVTQGLEDLKTAISLASGSNTIGNVKIAGVTYTIKRAVINFAAGGDSTIVAAVAGKKISVVSMALTVGGETNITLKSGANAISGPMDFGGTNEPRGMTIYHGECPLQTNEGEAFIINSSAAVQISGYITYYEA